MRFVLFAPLLLACQAPSPGPGAEAPPITASALHWLDDAGRAVIHRGVNLNNHAKNDPTYHHGLDRQTLALLPANGITLVRYLVFWQALEPDQGRYDTDYVEQIRADLAQLDALGLEVVLDFHQDVYGQGFGATGFPAWTCDQALYDAHLPNPNGWFLNYTDPPVIACFDRFWGSDALQQSYAKMAAHLVDQVGDSPALVGLDVINEPFWGSLDVEVHDTVVLPAFYQRVATEVWAVDPTLMLWLAPSVANNLTGQPLLDLSGLVDAGPVGLTPHFYPSYAELATGYDGDFSEESVVLANQADAAKAQGVPLFLGEFGIFSSQGNEDRYSAQVLAAIEGAGGSSAWWSYDLGSNVLSAEAEAGWLLPTFARPYPHRVPGRLESWDGDQLTLSLSSTDEVVWVSPGRSCTATVDGVEAAVRRSENRSFVTVTPGELRQVRLFCER